MRIHLKSIRNRPLVQGYEYDNSKHFLTWNSILIAISRPPLQKLLLLWMHEYDFYAPLSGLPEERVLNF